MAPKYVCNRAHLMSIQWLKATTQAFQLKEAIHSKWYMQVVQTKPKIHRQHPND